MPLFAVVWFRLSRRIGARTDLGFFRQATRMDDEMLGEWLEEVLVDDVVATASDGVAAATPAQAAPGPSPTAGGESSGSGSSDDNSSGDDEGDEEEETEDDGQADDDDIASPSKPAKPTPSRSGLLPATHACASASIATAGGEHKCSVCWMTDADPDLGSTSGCLMTPFRSGVGRKSVVLCVHCDAYFRYQDAGTGRSASALVQQHREDAQSRKRFLMKFACVMALKSVEGESRVKVTKKSTEMYHAFALRYTDILRRLMTRHGLSDDAPQQTAFLGLEEYVRLHGNPLTNQERIQTLHMNDQLLLAVRTAKPTAQDRFALEGMVTSAAGGFRDHHLDELARIRVDDLASASVVRHLVSEYASQRRVFQSLQGGLQKGGGACSASAASGSSLGYPATEGSRPADSSKRRKVSRCSAAAGASTTASSPPPLRRATSAHRLPSPPTSSKGALVPYAPAMSRPTAASSGAGTPAAPKVIDRLIRRVLKLCFTFTSPKWYSSLKAKERACHNAIEDITDTQAELKEACREDLFDDLAHFTKVCESALALIIEGRRSRRLIGMAQQDVKFCQHIALVDSFLYQHHGPGEDSCVEPQLYKIIVALGRSGVHYCGSLTSPPPYPIAKS